MPKKITQKGSKYFRKLSYKYMMNILRIYGISLWLIPILLKTGFVY